MSLNATLKFLGAAERVTGSCYHIRLGKRNILLDCGMTQGESQIHDWQRFRFKFRPENIDVVILSHVHIDHSGLLPLLVAKGFNGKIICTKATKTLLPILLKDSVFLYQKDLEWQNKRLARGGKPTLKPVMSAQDVERVVELSEGYAYEQRVNPFPELELVFSDAGHVLGSAIVQLWLKRGQAMRHVVFSGDLGNPDTVLMRDPTPIKQADVVLMEGTYGDRNHKTVEDTLHELTLALDDAHASGGNVFIPAFALGRTQEILYYLGVLYHTGRLKQRRVFLDSPMASAITEVYNKSFMSLNKDDTRIMTEHHAENLAEFLPILRVTETVEESMAINRIAQGAIIIAGSGMCNGGRIVHHLKNNLWKSQNHIVFVGFQARGTLGRRLVDGEKNIRLFGQQMVVNAQIHTLGGFSAHAGQRELLAWARQIAGQPIFYLIHGERHALEALQTALADIDIHADIPVLGDRVDL